MSYNSFCNPYSVDISKLSPQNSIMNSLYNSNIVSILNGQNPLDLSPFKIVTLDWLLQIGKYKPSFIYSNFIMFQCYFLPTDAYMPVGDLCIEPALTTIPPNSSLPSVNDLHKYLDTSQIAVLLVKNDPAFCRIVSGFDTCLIAFVMLALPS